MEGGCIIVSGKDANPRNSQFFFWVSAKLERFAGTVKWPKAPASTYLSYLQCDIPVKHCVSYQRPKLYVCSWFLNQYPSSVILPSLVFSEFL